MPINASLFMRKRIAGLGFQAFCASSKARISLAFGVRTRSIEAYKRSLPMTVHDLPRTARGLAVVVAIALVSTVLAPLIFVAANVVA
jgi:hypothetical protein